MNIQDNPQIGKALHMEPGWWIEATVLMVKRSTSCQPLSNTYILPVSLTYLCTDDLQTNSSIVLPVSLTRVLFHTNSCILPCCPIHLLWSIPLNWYQFAVVSAIVRLILYSNSKYFRLANFNNHSSNSLSIFLPNFSNVQSNSTTPPTVSIAFLTFHQTQISPIVKFICSISNTKYWVPTFIQIIPNLPTWIMELFYGSINPCYNFVFVDHLCTWKQKILSPCAS